MGHNSPLFGPQDKVNDHGHRAMWLGHGQFGGRLRRNRAIFHLPGRHHQFFPRHVRGTSESFCSRRGCVGEKSTRKKHQQNPLNKCLSDNTESDGGLKFWIKRRKLWDRERCWSPNLRIL